MRSEGYSREREDLSLRVKSVGGQTYADIRPGFRVLDLEFEFVGQSQVDQLDAILDRVGTHTSFFVQVDPAAPESDLKNPVYVKLADLPQIEVSSHDDLETKYDYSLELEQQL